jgi:hypothetical protein
MRYTSKELEPAKITKAVKKILGESLSEIETMGLAPFEASNPFPGVCNLHFVFSTLYLFFPFVFSYNAGSCHFSLMMTGGRLNMSLQTL